MRSITVEESGAFVERFALGPSGDGPLAGLRFAVKDLIDVAGHRTGCGNPTWLATHPPAAVHAVCVELLLAAGATCEGKTVTDELAFSLLGENHHYGTPLNPAAPDRVPGGSSSGSASAVACGLVDFAVGTDSGGSVRVPASNCGIWGWRPTHGAVSIAGVVQLSPTYDTVGLFAHSAEILHRSAQVLLAADPPPAAMPERILLLGEAFASADPDTRDALYPALDHAKKTLGLEVQQSSLAELCGDASAGDLATWRECYVAIMAAESASCHAAWIAAEQPELGPMALAGFQFVQSLDRRQVGDVMRRRENYCRRLARALGPRELLCLPTAPTISPLKGSIGRDRNSDYYQRTLSLTSIAGVARMPQVSMPLATSASAPIGLSLISAAGEDLFLLGVARAIEKQAARK
jgi:amidase